MKSLKDITAEEVMEPDFLSVSPETKLSKIKALMEDENTRELPVIDGKKFKGMVNFRKVLQNLHKDPTNISADSVMHQPPKVENEIDLIELADMRRNSGSKTIVHVAGNKLKGIIGDKQMTSPLTNSVKEFHNLRVKDMMNQEIVTLEETAKYDEADSIMEEENFSRVPIVDSTNRIMGVVTSLDLMRAMVPKEQMQQGDAKGYKESMSDIPVRELMDTKMALVKDLELPVSKAVKKMNKYNTRELIVINEEEKPLGLLTMKDLIDYMSTYKESEELMVNLVGIDNDGQKDMIYDKIETVVQGKISRILNRPRELKIHIKKAETDGRKMRYNVNLKLYSELGTTIIQKEGWDLLNAIDEVLDGLKEKLTSQKQKRRDRIREQWRKGKYNK